MIAGRRRTKRRTPDVDSTSTTGEPRETHKALHRVRYILANSRQVSKGRESTSPEATAPTGSTTYLSKLMTESRRRRASDLECLFPSFVYAAFESTPITSLKRMMAPREVVDGGGSVNARLSKRSPPRLALPLRTADDAVTRSSWSESRLHDGGMKLECGRRAR